MIEYLDMVFDWDEVKAKANEHKHKISFLEAMTAFDDENALITDDEKYGGKK